MIWWLFFDNFEITQTTSSTSSPANILTMLDLLLESVISRECKHWTKTSLYKPWETSQKTWRCAVLEIQCQYFSSFQKGISHLTVNNSMQTDWWHMKKFKYYSSTSRLYVTYYKTQDWKWFCVCMAINIMRMY